MRVSLKGETPEGKTVEVVYNLYDEYSKKLELRPFIALRRFFKIYVRGFPGASELRNELMATNSTDEVRELLSRHQVEV